MAGPKGTKLSIQIYYLPASVLVKAITGSNAVGNAWEWMPRVADIYACSTTVSARYQNSSKTV